ncbi:DNA polymerase/3'-5' exonuclease PolX [Candidatus Bathyarchaeota archaeon]|nr:DNA polymerase/3'-5' exonuclease PolX [Candidatus Bathyarchaeota archaeon]
MKNSEVAELLYEIADYLEIKDVEWKPRAYRRAAGTIETHSEPIEDVYERGELAKIPGIGESIAEKIADYLETGSIEYLEGLREDVHEGLRDLMNVEGIGPKTAQKLYMELEITSIDELEKAAKDQKIRELEGFGEKSEEDILRNIKMHRSHQERFLLGYKLRDAEEIVKILKNRENISRVNLAGSIRRRKATIGDIDILITIDGNHDEVMDFFTSMEQVDIVISRGERKGTVVLENGVQADLMIIAPETYGAALQYFTGNKQHNIKLRNIALEKNWKLSEYGLIDRENEDLIAGESEEQIYKALDLVYIEPELRTDRGEIDAAREGRLPELIAYDSLKGDLHTHSKWSEGNHSIKEMAERAMEMDYEYIAMTDHSKTLAIAQGLTVEDYRERQKEIDNVNEELDFRVLSGTEVEIDSDGKLDLPDSLLKDLDFVIASIHSGFKQSEEKITNRILSAISNDYVDAIGHPTGRLLLKRDQYDVNLDKIYEAAEERGVSLEINAFPTRLDLPDTEIQKAKEFNIKFALGTDSHNIEHLRFMEFGIANARRGWLKQKDVLNTMNLREIEDYLNI